MGTINVILAALGRTGSFSSRVMSIDRPFAKHLTFDLKRSKVNVQPALSFSDEDKVRTSQPYDDALVVTLRIGGYDLKRVLVDQGSGVEIMYPNLYKRLRLKPEDLTNYDPLLVGFDGKTIIPFKQDRKWWRWTSLWWMHVPLTLLLWPDFGFMPWELFLPLYI